MKSSHAHDIAEDYSWLPPVPPRNFRLMPGEKVVMRPRPDQTASEWGHGNRYVAVGAMPGTYDIEVTPYAKGLLDLYSHPDVRELALAGGSQSAKTDIMHTAWGWVQETEPDQALIVMQDRDTGTETIQERLIPMIRYTPSLRKLHTKSINDISAKKIRLRNGATTYLAWAGSERRLASKPIRYGFFDEVDLWPEESRRKARARLRTYESLGMSKLIEACTVSILTGAIWQSQLQAHAVVDFYAVCPHCGHAQTLKFGQLHWREDVLDPSELSGRDSAWYECESCLKPWDEEDRDEAVRRGARVHNPVSWYDPDFSFYGWRPRPGSVRSAKPEKIWAHIPPLISRFVEFHKVAAAYLEMQLRPTPANSTYFWNDCCGLPLPEDADGCELPRETELYKTHRQSWIPDGAKWQIPMAACVLTADVDVQANRLECEVVAWGHGHESWGVAYKVFHGDPLKDDPQGDGLGCWAQLHAYLSERRFRHESGADLRVAKVGIDIGFAARQVAKFVRRDRRYLAHKGSKDASDPLIPRKPSRSKHGVPFYLLGVSEGKDTLFSWLTAQDGPRCCHFPLSYDFEWFRMLCAEHPVRERDRKTGKLVSVWKLREGYNRNEPLDIRVGNMAVREILNPNYTKLAKLLEPIAPEPESEADDAAKEEKPAVPAKRLKKGIRKVGGGFVSSWNKRGM